MPSQTPQTTNINFWRDPNSGLELIFCQNSTISYPRHNHISVYCLGVLLAGSLTLTLGNSTRLIEAKQIFLIPPYLPHQLTANSPYTMLTICLPARRLPTFDLLEPVKTQLETRPELDLNLDEMAAQAHLSKYHFLRRFKQAIGLTPHQFQLQNRVRKAQRLLNRGGRLTEVALTTGFCDQSHFNKNFIKHLGITPTAYQAACRQLPNSKPV